jgi:hypothetical protein
MIINKKMILCFLISIFSLTGCSQKYNAAYPKDAQYRQLHHAEIDTSADLADATAKAAEVFKEIDEIQTAGMAVDRLNSSGRFNTILREYKRSKE